MTEIRKALPAELANCKALGDGRLEFIVSHEAPDLAGDVVVQRGIRAASPRLPAQVDHSGRMADTVGFWTDLKCHGDYTTATLNLVKAGISPMADLVRGLSEAGVKLAASIGFTSRSVEPRKEKGFKFNESTLHEISVVVVPCQPLAVQIAKSFGLEAVISPEPQAPAVSGVKSPEAIKRAKAAILAANRARRK
jgi:hypothetical protein